MNFERIAESRTQQHAVHALARLDNIDAVGEDERASAGAQELLDISLGGDTDVDKAAATATSKATARLPGTNVRLAARRAAFTALSNGLSGSAGVALSTVGAGVLSEVSAFDCRDVSKVVEPFLDGIYRLGSSPEGEVADLTSDLMCREANDLARRQIAASAFSVLRQSRFQNSEHAAALLGEDILSHEGPACGGRIARNILAHVAAGNSPAASIAMHCLNQLSGEAEMPQHLQPLNRMKRLQTYLLERETLGAINRLHDDCSPRQPRVCVQEQQFSESAAEAREAVRAVMLYRRELLTQVSRQVDDKRLEYTVINGNDMRTDPSLASLHVMGMAFQGLAENLWGAPLVPLNDQAAVNVNIVDKGGEQGWHKDRNEVTVLMYLTNTAGGTLEVESEAGKVTQVPIRDGTLVVLVGANQIRHRVAPVKDTDPPRIALVASFGLPGKDYNDPRRDNFLYSGHGEIKDQKVF